MQGAQLIKAREATASGLLWQAGAPGCLIVRLGEQNQHPFPLCALRVRLRENDAKKDGKCIVQREPLARNASTVNTYLRQARCTKV